jgi:DNA-binding HxlR family transcriptional regulator
LVISQETSRRGGGGVRAWVELEPIYETLRFFGHNWTLEILASLTRQPKRFNALQRDTANISSRTQSEVLKRLVDHGLVRHPDDGDGLHYELTPLGERVLPALVAFVKELSEWREARGGDRSHHP